MPRGCGVYLVAIIYVPSGKSIVGAVRMLEEIGARIVDVDEELRRIVVNISINKHGELVDSCNKYSSTCSMEVKASCRWTPDRCILRDLGFRSVKSRSGIAYYGVYEGRIVEVEVTSSKSKIKIGRETKSRIINPPIPPGVFILDPGEVEEASSILEKFLDYMVNSSGC